MASYYDRLGVAADAGDEEVRRAYLARAQRLHPDRHAESPESVRRQAEAEMKAVNEAWNTLKDPETRQSYDLALDLAWAETQPASPPSFFRRAGVQLVIVALIVAGLVGSLVAAIVSGGGPSPESGVPGRWTPAAVSELRTAAINAGLTYTQADCLARYITDRYSPADEVDVSILGEAAGACR